MKFRLVTNDVIWIITIKPISNQEFKLNKAFLFIHRLVFHELSSIVHWVFKILFMHSYFRSVISHHNSLQKDKKKLLLLNSPLPGMLFTLFNRLKAPYAAKIHFSIAHYCYMFAQALCQKGYIFY